jgi:membrane protein DedA with SNARE-associated domain
MNGEVQPGKPVALIVFALHLHLLHRGVPAANIDYVAVALGAFASWAGLPGPGEPLLIAAAIVASKHKLDITPVLVWAFVGALLGGIVGWLAGVVAGRNVLAAPGPLRRLRLRGLERGDEVFERLTIIAILLTPAWVAGIHRVGSVIYLTVNLVTAAIWAVGIGLAAYYAGPPVLEWLSDVGLVSSVGLGVLILVAVGFEVARRRRRRVRSDR